MQLRRLAAMERTKLKDEEKELRARIRYLEELLASESKQLDLIKEETTEIKKKYATPRRTTIVDAAPGEGEAPVTVADLAVPDDPQQVVLTTSGIQRYKASTYSYDVKSGVSGRAVSAHRASVYCEPTDRVFFVAGTGQVWTSAVGQVPEKATFAQMGLPGNHEIVHIGSLVSDGFLILGTRQGRVKRVEMSVVEGFAERLWTEIIGLEAEDRVLFAGICKDDGDILFFTTARVLRTNAGNISSQQTPSARGVIGIKLQRDDLLLGGEVVADPKGYYVFTVSETGFIKRVPIEEFSYKGRGTMGVLSLNQTKATGRVVAAGAGKVTQSTSVDVLGAGGKRQRLSYRSVPIENRANRGKKLIKLPEPTQVVVLN
jgi:DNA gyrase subunit A